MKNLEDLKHNIYYLKEKIDLLQGERNSIIRQGNDIENKLESIQEDINTYIQVRRLLELLVKSTEIKLRSYIEPVITEALDFVFEQGLVFHLFLSSRRNQQEVDFVVLRTDDSEKNYQIWIQDPIKYEDELAELLKETKDINYMYGGSVNQVLSIVLRILIVELLKIQGPIFFDEPSSAIGEQYTAKLGQLISTLSKRYDRQIILITHSSTLASYSDRIYDVTQINKVSQVVLSKE